MRESETGKAIKGIAVAAVAEVRLPQTEGTEFITVGILASDHAGYVSFDTSRFMHRDDLMHLWVYPFADETLRTDALPVLRLSGEPGIVPMRIPGPLIPELPELPELPSTQNPDPTDWKVSPGSFSAKNVAVLGEGGCEELLLSYAPERTFRFTQIVRNPDEHARFLPKAESGPCNLIDEFHPPPPDVCYQLGAVLEYELRWLPLGHGLGEVLYSLPLAPCESVNLAVIDWSRREEAARGENITVQEELIHNQRRDRVIEETVTASLREWQRGGSLMGGLAAAGSWSFLSGVASLGGGYSTTAATRSLAAETVNRLADTIVQASAFTRRLHSSVVVQSSQAERDVIETRTVTNHNHCHALTVLYYEVLRHFCVSTRLADRYDVVLIQYAGRDSFIDDFTVDDIICNRPILEQVLLDAHLRPCFEVVEKLFCARGRFERRRFVEEPVDFELETLHIRFTTGEQGPPVSPLEVYLYTHSETLIPLDRSEQERLFRPVAGGNFIPLAEAHQLLGLRESEVIHTVVDGRDRYREAPDATFAFSSNLQEDIFTLRPRDRVRWGYIDSIEIQFEHGGGPGAPWDLVHLYARTYHDSQLWVLFDGTIPGGPRFHDGSDEEPARIRQRIPVHPIGPRSPEDLLTEEEHCCIDRLRKHLNCNAYHYNRAIWLFEDPDQRASRLERYNLDGRPLLDQIENRAVDVSGDYVAFPLKTSAFADEQTTDEAREVIVSLPTRGVFAEAKLAHCDACEERDITRLWDWTKPPCPEKAPAIEGIGPESRAGAIDTRLSTLPEAILGIQAPATAPTPAGLAAITELLKEPNIFRDLSGRKEVAAILTELIRGAVALRKKQLELEAKEEEEEEDDENGDEDGENGGDEDGEGEASNDDDENGE